ncbi:chromate resistance protein ChrB domain-containing protein [Gilvimarinus algae]|uniref:Chromate resistance protein n=1 Tax=Gilvimarinus algae TaxID=3058037 RepID=A0ABT8TE52_9GAMM|nr:chromate resistance protein ChrB domain-containing protein [Gilvimarinus sp. SDUM040014]MDO3382370.1 chromate resistance protein [Gilvimarinus sp. SDUM040014]
MYYTLAGEGPDKWASAWLLKRKISAGSTISVVSEREIKEQNPEFTFDVPGSPFTRNQHQTTFEVLLQNHETTDRATKRLALILNDIEVNLWRANRYPESETVEQAFRLLQRRYDIGKTPINCYLGFFDTIASAIDNPSTTFPTPSELVPNESCSIVEKPRNKPFVREMELSEILTKIADGEKVVFIDSREPSEYEESHIPGAINLKIRDVATANLDELKKANLVVAYCVKDFRGFEMARQLHKHGVSQAVIAKPYGLRGWIDSGLPVTKPNETIALDAFNEIKRIAQDQLD